MSKKRPKNAPAKLLEQCHLYRIRSPHALAKRLGWDLHKLDQLAADGGYKVYPHKQTGRIIQEPCAALQSIHRQIHRYLARVAVPAYLHSAVKGRSYVSNAEAHVGLGGLVKIDIAKFYQSTPQHKVMHFFRDRLRCAPDVAGLLANLICFNGHLATGSAASPILSYYTFKDLFDRLHEMAERRHLRMTCYVDDITISGVGANNAVLHEARTMIFQAGLRGHKDRAFAPGQPKIVTGVVVDSTGLNLPFSRWQKIKIAEREVDQCVAPAEQVAKFKPLVSRLYEAGQIDGRCMTRARFHHERWRVAKRRLEGTSSAETPLEPSIAA